ncbi:hypothetical protein FACS1894133_3190 [Clostridia bacterium]|nr:hypothetical protein FACS1894133_3190 [Clostridia bacterium]
MFITGLKKRESDIWVSRDLGDTFELDEMYWFIGFKARSSTRENIYIILIICPEPREIVGFSVSRDKSQDRIQSIVDSAPSAEYYNTDGYLGYIDVVYPGKHVRNARDKSDTHNVESTNADLRHYIPAVGAAVVASRKRK